MREIDLYFTKKSDGVEYSIGLGTEYTVTEVVDLLAPITKGVRPSMNIEGDEMTALFLVAPVSEDEVVQIRELFT